MDVAAPVRIIPVVRALDIAIVGRWRINVISLDLWTSFWSLRYAFLRSSSPDQPHALDLMSIAVDSSTKEDIIRRRLQEPDAPDWLKEFHTQERRLRPSPLAWEAQDQSGTEYARLGSWTVGLSENVEVIEQAFEHCGPSVEQMTMKIVDRLGNEVVRLGVSLS